VCSAPHPTTTLGRVPGSAPPSALVMTSSLPIAVEDRLLFTQRDCRENDRLIT
jgi:hypothetical protein